MIKITRLNHSELVVNANLIEFVEATPDTVITLTSDRHIVVQESVEEVIMRVLAFLRAANEPLPCRCLLPSPECLP